MGTKVRMALLALAALSLATSAMAQLTPAEEGRRVFLANNCYGCHGGRAGGTPFLAPQFRSEKAELGDLREAVREGEDRGMPAFPNLTATDVNNLYAYFQSIRTSSEPKFNNWWEPVPTASIQKSDKQVYALTRRKERSFRVSDLSRGK